LATTMARLSPASAASASAQWMSGDSETGNSSFGSQREIGCIRVPSPPHGMIAVSGRATKVAIRPSL